MCLGKLQLAHGRPDCCCALQRRWLSRVPQRTSACSSTTTTSNSRSCCSAAFQKGIFDREAEHQHLDSLQHTSPARVTVVLGPRSCGKTCLLQDLFAKQRNAVYVDCRAIDATTPAGLIEALLSKLAARLPQKKLEELAPTLLAGVLSSVPLTAQNGHPGKVSLIVKELVNAFQQQQQQNLNAVYSALR